MAKINKCNAKQSKTQIEIKWPHLHTKARFTHTHTQGEGDRQTWYMAKTSHSQEKIEEWQRGGGRRGVGCLTEIKCSSCAAPKGVGNKGQLLLLLCCWCASGMQHAACRTEECQRKRWSAVRGGGGHSLSWQMWMASRRDACPAISTFHSAGFEFDFSLFFCLA